MKIALVGSSIHGDLLSPNDKDIAVECETKRELRDIVLLLGGTEYQALKGDINLAIIKNGNVNNIIFHGFTIEDYVKSMDLNIVRGYKDLKTKQTFLFKEAKEALRDKLIKVLPRKKLHEVFNYYPEQTKERITKYLDKLPEGWTFQYTKRKEV